MYFLHNQIFLNQVPLSCHFTKLIIEMLNYYIYKLSILIVMCVHNKSAFKDSYEVFCKAFNNIIFVIDWKDLYQRALYDNFVHI